MLLRGEERNIGELAIVIRRHCPGILVICGMYVKSLTLKKYAVMAPSTQNPNGGFTLIYQNPYLLGVASVSFIQI